MNLGPTDGQILREIAEQEAKGATLEDAILGAAVVLGLDVDEVWDLWVLYDAMGTGG